ncbi:MAG: peptidoglycan-binding protein [bacterium]
MNYKTLLVALAGLAVAIPVFASEVTGNLCTGLGCPVQGTVIGAPTASPVAGSYNTVQSVSLLSSGATSIRYTEDNTTPTCTSTQYVSPISVASTKTIKAISCYPNNTTSTVASFAYVLSCSAVSNAATYNTFPTCGPATCNSGYTVSGGSCVVLSSGGGGGGGSGMAVVVPTNIFVSINNGANIANSQNVTLNLSATNASLMMVSNLANFSDITTWEAYGVSKPWVLTTGDGIKTVYVKFKSASGYESTSISDTIVLQTGVVISSSVNNTQTTSYGSQGGAGSVIFTLNLSLGSTGTEVIALQNRLIAEGLYSGAVTGYYGPLTVAAVKKYQAKYGIAQLGNVGPATRLKLNYSVANYISSPVITPITTSPAYVFKVNLALNSKGADVVALQRILVAGGYLVMPDGIAYGNFGGLTQKALGKYQEANNIAKPGDPGYGTVGPKTRARLNQ